MALFPSNKKTLLQGSGDLPFDLEINEVHLDLKQDEHKIVLGIDYPGSRAEMVFDIYYPNGTPDEMSDRETKLREEIAALKIVNAGLGQQLGRAMADNRQPAFFPLEKNKSTRDGDWFMVCVSEKPSDLERWKVRKFIGGRSYDRNMLDCGRADYSHIYRIINPELLQILNDTGPSSLGKCKELEDEIVRLRDQLDVARKCREQAVEERDCYRYEANKLKNDIAKLVAQTPETHVPIAKEKLSQWTVEEEDARSSLREALGERDLYKSQLDALHAKYEAVVALNLKLQAGKAPVHAELLSAVRYIDRARNYLENQG